MQLINGNCLDTLKSLKDNSVDLTVTSPPYNMNLRIRAGKYCSRQLVKEISTKYVGYDDNLPMEKYFEFNKNVLNELLRVSKIVFYNVQVLTGNKPALFRLIGEFHEYIKEIIIWDKVNAQPAINKNVMNSQFELILVLTKDKKDSMSRQFKKANFDRGTLENLWRIKRGKKINKDHGATFPEELIEKILLNFSSEGDIILDPMMGTGTTGVVSKRLKRNFIGIELLKTYFSDAVRRIQDD